MAAFSKARWLRAFWPKLRRRIDDHRRSVVGTDYGISALKNGSGALSITTTGAVYGKYNSGIAARNYGGSLTISAANVVGGMYGATAGAKGDGIYALNQGSGALSITTSGTVRGFGAGIEARNYGTNLTVSAANVTGGTFGVYAVNQGSGALSITTADRSSAAPRHLRQELWDLAFDQRRSASGKVEGIGAYNQAAASHHHVDRVGKRRLELRRWQRLPIGAGRRDQAENPRAGGTGSSAWTTARRPLDHDHGRRHRIDGTGIFAYGAYGSGLTVKTYGPVTGSVNGVYANVGAYGQATPRPAPCRSPRPDW